MSNVFTLTWKLGSKSYGVVYYFVVGTVYLRPSQPLGSSVEDDQDRKTGQIVERLSVELLPQPIYKYSTQEEEVITEYIVARLFMTARILNMYFLCTILTVPSFIDLPGVRHKLGSYV